jgi:hypothetical protein
MVPNLNALGGPSEELNALGGPSEELNALGEVPGNDLYDLNDSQNLDLNDSANFSDDNSYLAFSEPAESTNRGFKLYGTHFFLTYHIPKSMKSLSLKEISDFFENKFGELFKRCIVSFEKSQNKQRHIHVYLNLKKRKYYSKKEHFDLKFGEVIIKGHYLKADSRNLAKCKIYIKKEGDWFDSNPNGDPDEIEDRRITKQFLKNEIGKLYKLHGDDLQKVKREWIKLLTVDYPDVGIHLVKEIMSTWEALLCIS